MAAAKKGDVVNVSLASGEHDLLGLYVKDSGDKDVVQVGSSLHTLAYREPGDRDSQGSGGTWWKL